LAEDEFNRKS
jgi:serine/threonine protein phosphatase PrpC